MISEATGRQPADPEGTARERAIAEAISRFADGQSRGETLDIEGFCRENASLLPELREQLETWQGIDAILDSARLDSAGNAVADLDLHFLHEGRPPVVIQDTFSGASYSGGRAPQALYNQIGGVVNLLSYNSYTPVRIKRIECETQIQAGRRNADMEAVELSSDTYAPGETLRP